MATVAISHVNATSGLSLSVTIERLSDGYFFNPTTSLFQAALTFTQKKIALSEGVNENAKCYTASVSNVSGPTGLVDPGLVRIRVHNEGAANETIDAFEGHVVANEFVRLDRNVSTRATPDEVATELLTLLSSTLTLTELTSLPPKEPTLPQAIALLYMAIRNKSTSTSDRVQYHNDIGSPIVESVVTDDGSTFSRGKLRSVTGG